MPAFLRSPPQVLSNSQSQVFCVMTESQQVGPVCPNLGQTSWRCSQRVGGTKTQTVDEVNGITTCKKVISLVILPFQQLQELGVTHSLC